MSTERLPQDSERDVVLEAGQACRDEQLAQFGGWPLDRPFPILLTPADLQRVFQIAPSTYFKLQALGRFTKFEAPSVLGAGRGVRRAVRYSGPKVKAFLENDSRARTFGAKRGPRPAKPVSVLHAAQSTAQLAGSQR